MARRKSLFAFLGEGSARHPVALEQGKGVRRKGDEVFGVGMAQMEFAVEGGKVLQSIADAVEVGKDADGARLEAAGLSAV